MYLLHLKYNLCHCLSFIITEREFSTILFLLFFFSSPFKFFWLCESCSRRKVVWIVSFLSPRPQSSVRRCPRSSWKRDQAEASSPRTQTPPEEKRERHRGREGRWPGIPILWFGSVFNSKQTLEIPQIHFFSSTVFSSGLWLVSDNKH